jgi:dTDP-4-amino-4,6-dideoxygalactose transaminase
MNDQEGALPALKLRARPIVLDGGFVAAELSGPGTGWALAQIAQAARAGRFDLWIPVVSLPGLHQRLADAAGRAALAELLRSCRVLGCGGWEASAALPAPDDAELALVLASMATLGGDAKLVRRGADPMDPRQRDAESILRSLREPAPERSRIELADLACQQRRVLPELEKRVAAVLRHGRYIMGPEIAELERRLGAYTGTAEVVACASGTDALLMALMAFGVQPGDAVFTTPFTFVATAEVVSLLGATPVFVDVDPLTFNLDPLALRQAVERTLGEGRLRARGIIAVDIFGVPADYAAIGQVAGDHGLFVIEDAAQSLGAAIGGRRCGSFGDVAATSFFPSKTLGAYGDGGALFTDDAGLAERLRSIRIHGMGRDKYDNVRIGLNGRLDTLQAAILLAKLDVLPEELAMRRAVAESYLRMLPPGLAVQTVPPDCVSAWAQFAICAEPRDPACAALTAADVAWTIYYRTPLHLQPAFAALGYRPGQLPCSEAISRTVVNLPMHPYLTAEEIERVCMALGSTRS